MSDDDALDPTAGMLPAERRELLNGAVIAVAAQKGGVGKTFLSYELGWLWDAVAVDLEWEGGGLSRYWGYLHENRLNVPLLDALEKGRTPRPLRGRGKVDLVPGHPDLGQNEPPADVLAVALERWAGEWGRPVVVDTHPGTSTSLTQGALAAARVVVVPVILAERELTATEEMVRELADYALLLVPNRVPPVPSAAHLATLRRISETYGVPVGPPVSNREWINRRRRRTALSSQYPPSKRNAEVIEELHAVAEVVIKYGDAWRTDDA